MGAVPAAQALPHQFSQTMLLWTEEAGSSADLWFPPLPGPSSFQASHDARSAPGTLNNPTCVLTCWE